jgi:radical SAM protein with 4Fe4S-binding SPASM domain
MEYTPFIISWNITRRCNLRCSHCYLDASELEQGGDDELTTREGLKLIDSIAGLNPHAFLVLTGGEPLLREDIFELASHASSTGLMVLLGTNGTLLTEATVEELKRCGVKGLGMSIDSLDHEIHDSFRGMDGCLSKTMEGIEICRSAGLEFQVQTTAMRENLSEIPAIINFSHEAGAKAFNLFFLVCTGRGQDLTDLTAEQYEETLSLLLKEQSKNGEMMIRARCAPHFKRVIRQNNPGDFLAGAETSGCLAATNYFRITPDGDLTPCPYMPLTAGNVREDSLESIWRDSEILQSLRTSPLKGKCGRCEFSEICGGCRARALSLKGDPMEEDPWCLHQPTEERETEVKERDEPQWTEEAERRLSKIPFFIRGSVKKGIIEYARSQGLSTITPEVLAQLKKKARPR